MRRRKPLSKKAKTIITVASLATVVGALVAGYAVIINEVLLDFENMPYIKFSYEEGNSNEIRIDKVYENSDYPANFRIPKKLLNKPVTTIADEAFRNLSRLTSVEFPSTIKYIGDYAFDNCKQLKSVTFNNAKNLEHVGVDAFAGSEFINSQPSGPVYLGKILYTYNGELESNTAIVPNESVTVPGAEHYIYLDDYNQIGSGAFMNKHNLIYVEFTSKFHEITQNTFQNCDNLKTVKLAKNTITIAKYAFSGCSALEDINLDSTKSLTTIGEYAFDGIKLDGNLTLSDSITSIGEGAFANTTNLDSVTFPSKLTTISKYLFENSGISSVTFKNEDNATKSTIHTIGIGAFKNTNLTTFKLPFGVTTINESVFEECSSLETVYLYDNTTGTTFSYETTKTDDQGEIIPTTVIKKHGVENLNQRAFYNTTSLKDVVLLDKDGNATSSTNLLSFPSSTIVRVEREAFSGSGVTHVEIPDTLYYMGESVFEGCENLESVEFVNKATATMPRSFKEFKSNTFEGCTSLTSIVIPNYVNNISSSSFKGCSALASVTFEDGATLKTFSSSLFEDCTSLTSIVIPNSVTSLKDRSLANTGIKSIVINKNVVNFDAYIFDGCSSDLIIYVGEGTNITSTTKVSPNWNKNKAGNTFTTALYSEEAPTSEGTYWHYVDGVPTLWEAN